MFKHIFRKRAPNCINLITITVIFERDSFFIDSVPISSESKNVFFFCLTLLLFSELISFVIGS